MAIPKSSKRKPASAAAGAAAAKKVKTSVNAVTKAVLNAELPSAICSVLSTAAPYALADYAEARTPHQAAVVDMVGSALSGIQASLQKAVADAKIPVDGKGEEKTTREAAVFEAAKLIAAKKGEAAEKEYATLEATQAFKKADVVLKEAVKLQKVGDKDYVALVAKKEKLEAVKAKLAEVKAWKKPEVSALEKEMKPFEIDESMVKSMYLCLTKEPAEMTEFEKITMEKLAGSLNEKLEALNKEIAGEQPAKDGRAAALEKASTEQAGAKGKLEECKTAYSEASSAVGAAEAALKEAEGKVASYVGDMEALEAVLEGAKDKLSDFEDGPLSAFEMLKDHAAPPPEPEEAAPAEEPAASSTAA